MRPSSFNQLVIGTVCFFKFTSGHSFILAIEGGNRRRSTGFGTRLTSRGNLVQNTGIILQKEITSGATTACGRIFGGDGLKPFVIDVDQELALAEEDGVPSATEDGSISMSVYVHNPDGAGPYTCEFSSDATLQQLQPMSITTQIEGEKGTNPASKDFAYPLVANLPRDAICRGGAGGDTCIMRCINPLGFGSCAAIKPFSPPNLPPNQPPNQLANQPGTATMNQFQRRTMILD
ncbi:hypothetical protein Pst134EA_031646 [Puccinia striiformis f. sp. tritici]|uniref:uncharacterized protein n=1 Tax=Puccinia striiformis f. sp. tritici TaxID=168172 RepID=UPI0020081A78|nr:uncharacterized protein Pst134EA_031646 [Puccinia striiformis f. sp. tritici]KAH9442676.1 hypothetical protein Pst134EA_031646 [Puccinia striiformis f. sp. tritici]KAH9457822.1 hypothetical protein Pst134EB_010134 [Puccinia striiformis f. sp. tritici]